MKNNFFFLVFSLFAFNLSSIEVEGHLTEDTTWSPDNNPYHVIDDVYVDDDVTLTILPGTIVKFNAAPLVNINSIDNYFVHYNGSNVAKMLWVDGKVIANGTEEEPITFTRIQDSLYYHWGIIYIREDADLCSFKYCDFKNSALILIVLGIIPRGAISIYNEGAIVENCNFIDNLCGVFNDRPVESLEVNYNNFYNIDNICPTYPYYIAGGINLGSISTGYFNPVLIAGNSFLETDISWGHVDIDNNIPAYVVNNYFFGEDGIHASMESDLGSYIYNNEFINCGSNGLSGGIFGGEEDNALYIKKNNFIGGYDGINIDDAYVEISDNYFEGCDLDTGYDSDGEIFNNELDNGEVFIGIDMEFYNNLVINYSGSNAAFSAYDVHNLGNLFYNNENNFSDNNDNFHTNCVILQSNDLFWSPILHGTSTFRNCIIDFELEYPLIDGGDNIWVDSLQAQTLFEDIQNGDFHLIEGSLAIDAGFDTLGYYYPFDMDYNHRVWDGDGNGSAIIDIGPYEFGSPAFGGIEGFTYNPVTGDPVDYVLLKIDNQPGEFTFSDSIGDFQFKLPAGIYDVYAERVFYDDVIEYQVEVIDGQFTNLFIPMTETVNIEDNTIILFSNDFNLTNYPNPFNPSTTLTFSIQNDLNVELSIFNIKGQKVNSLINEEMQKGKHTTIWYGVDENNKPVSSGIYIYKIKAGTEESVGRMLLLK